MRRQSLSALRQCLLGIGLACAATAAGAASRTIALDPLTSQARFSVQLRMMPDASGRFGQVSGELQAVAGGRWRVDLRIDARGLQMDGPHWLQRLTRSRHFLDVERYPELHFVSAPFAAGLLVDGGSLRGRLHLRGREREVEFALAPSTCTAPGYACAIEVSGEVSRRAFGMDAYRFALKDPVGVRLQARLTAALP